MWPNSWFPLVWLPFPIQASCWRYLGRLVPELFFLVSSVLKHHIPLFLLVSPILVPVPPLFLLRSSVLAPPTPPPFKATRLFSGQLPNMPTAPDGPTVHCVLQVGFLCCYPPLHCLAPGPAGQLLLNQPTNQSTYHLNPAPGSPLWCPLWLSTNPGATSWLQLPARYFTTLRLSKDRHWFLGSSPTKQAMTKSHPPHTHTHRAQYCVPHTLGVNLAPSLQVTSCFALVLSLGLSTDSSSESSYHVPLAKASQSLHIFLRKTNQTLHCPTH